MENMALKATAYVGENTITAPFLLAFIQGLRKNDVQVQIIYDRNPEHVEKADLHLFWGMKTTNVIQHCVEHFTPFVCLDHGYTKDRDNFASINLNNLNAKSELLVDAFAGYDNRCIKHEWRITPRAKLGHWHIITGQIHIDRSLEGNDVYAWATDHVEYLQSRGQYYIKFKPHPKEKEEAADFYQRVPAVPFFGDFEEACDLAACFHTFSSTSAAHAWLNGIPATAISPMSMIYEDQFLEPTDYNRQRWLNKISYRQFNLDELTDGLMWDLFKNQIIGKAPMSNPGQVCLYGKALEVV